MPNNTLQARQRQNQLFQQHENAAVLYTVNWAAELDADTISTSTWTEETSGATLSAEANTTTTASVRVKGSAGQRHVVTNKIVTASGDTKERQILVKVHDNTHEYVMDYCSCW